MVEQSSLPSPSIRGPSEESLRKYFTEEAKNYSPKDIDLYITNSKGEKQRCIFNDPLELMDHEQKYLEDFREYLKKNGNQMPDGVDNETRIVIRYLQGCQWNFDKTYQALQEYNQWRIDSFPVRGQEECDDYLRKGIIYSYKRDKGHRPIVIMNIEKLLQNMIEPEFLCRITDYLFTFLINECTIPSKIESWMIVMDVNNVGLTQVPQSLLKTMISYTMKYYRGRMYRLFAIRIHWLVRGIWKIVQPLLDEFTIQKVNVKGDDFQNDLHTWIDPANLEEKFGGKLPNKESDFFPPELV